MEKDRYQRLEKVAGLLREKTLTGAIERLIDRYESDQLIISELREHSEALAAKVNQMDFFRENLKQKAAEILRANTVMIRNIASVYNSIDRELKTKPARKPAKNKAAAKKKPIAKPRKK